MTIDRPLHIKGATQTVLIMTTEHTGTGWQLEDSNIVVTAAHVVAEVSEVLVVDHTDTASRMRIAYYNPAIDIAILAPILDKNVQGIKLPNSKSQSEVIRSGDHAIALGYPMGQAMAATSTVISDSEYTHHGISYLVHDARLVPGYSGGPLLDKQGNWLGLNVFIESSNDQTFSLSTKEIYKIIAQWMDLADSGVVQACKHCRHIILEDKYRDTYCPNCGTAFIRIESLEVYEPEGMYATIERLINRLGYEAGLTRRGIGTWVLHQGSAKIHITYQEKSGLLEADAVLVNLPNHDVEQIYRFLLEENYKLQGLSFSTSGHSVLLSLMIYDLYLHEDTALGLLKQLLQKADEYDDRLVRDFKALW